MPLPTRLEVLIHALYSRARDGDVQRCITAVAAQLHKAHYTGNRITRQPVSSTTVWFVNVRDFDVLGCVCVSCRYTAQLLQHHMYMYMCMYMCMQHVHVHVHDGRVHVVVVDCCTCVHVGTQRSQL